jgi:hypothetical protein
MTNDAAAPFPNGDISNLDPNTTGKIMQFRVKLPLKDKDKSEIPAFLAKIKKLKRKDIGKVRNITLDFTGRYVWHCHMLEHEDHDMMRPYTVLPKRN